MAGAVGTHSQTAGRHWFLDPSSHQAFPIIGTEKHAGHEAEIGYVLAATNGKIPKEEFPSVCLTKHQSCQSAPDIAHYRPFLQIQTAHVTDSQEPMALHSVSSAGSHT